MTFKTILPHINSAGEYVEKEVDKDNNLLSKYKLLNCARIPRVIYIHTYIFVG